MQTLVTDIEVRDQHLVVSDSLQTPIAISLLSWARAEPGDNVIDGGELNGWWGDDFADVPGDQFGSRLWTLIGLPMSKALPLAESFATDALQWLIEDQVVTDFEVSATDVGDHTCLLTITGTYADRRSDTRLASVKLRLS